MELIDRYVTAIGKHLPRKTRADIETEIHSTLEDMLADRSAKSGRPVDDAMAKEVLKDYGAPAEVAATYLPERYLIGPRLYPLFWLVVKIVFSVLTVLAFIGLGARIGTGPGTFESTLSLAGKALIDYITGLIAALGNIVLVMAILERVLPESELPHLKPSNKEDWDPDQLLVEPTGDEVKLWEPVAAILSTFAGLVIFNFYPQIIGVVVNLKNPVIVPVLSDAFFHYLPWLNLLWVVGIGLQLALLRQGRYTPPTRVLTIALKAGGIALAAAMLSGPSLVGMTASQLSAAGMNPGTARTLVEMLNTGIKVALILAVVAPIAEIIKEIYRLLVKPFRPRAIAAHK